MSLAIIKKKPANQRVKRFVENREPKAVENTKSAMFIRGEKTSEIITQVLKDLSKMKKPFASFYNKKNKIRPFEDPSSIEFFSQKTDSSLFAFGTHSKKRPHNLVLGRLFDNRVLDMIELGITNFRPISSKDKQPGFASKPAFIFTGSEFLNQEPVQKLGNIFLDMFRGHELNYLNLAGIDHVIALTSHENKIFFRHYSISLKKSGANVPRVELQDIGPSFDMSIRRTNFAPADLIKQASQLPKQLNPKKHKNVSKTSVAKIGTVYPRAQDMTKIALHKMKGSKRKRTPQTNEPNKKIKAEQEA